MCHKGWCCRKEVRLKAEIQKTENLDCEKKGVYVSRVLICMKSRSTCALSEDLQDIALCKKTYNDTAAASKQLSQKNTAFAEICGSFFKLQLQQSRFTYITSPFPLLLSWHSEMSRWIFIKCWVCLHSPPTDRKPEGTFQNICSERIFTMWCINDRVMLCKYVCATCSSAVIVSLTHAHKTQKYKKTSCFSAEQIIL